MTQDEIIKMAHEAGTTFVAQYGVASVTPEWLERFASLVAAAERTTVLNELADMVSSCDSRATPKGIAAAIRARGNA